MGLRLRLQPVHFPNDELKLKCVATIMKEVSQSSDAFAYEASQYVSGLHLTSAGGLLLRRELSLQRVYFPFIFLDVAFVSSLVPSLQLLFLAFLSCSFSIVLPSFLLFPFLFCFLVYHLPFFSFLYFTFLFLCSFSSFFPSFPFWLHFLCFSFRSLLPRPFVAPSRPDGGDLSVGVLSPFSLFALWPEGKLQRLKYPFFSASTGAHLLAWLCFVWQMMHILSDSL